MDILEGFVDWLEQHLQGTAHDKKQWQTKYLEDEPFFTNLAEFAHQVLTCGDLFETSSNPVRMNRLGVNLYSALGSLCLRVISFIPKMLEAPAARRDSAQPVASSQQQIPLFLYLSLLARLLNERTTFTVFLLTFGFRPGPSIARTSQAILSDEQIIPSLNAVLLNLSVRPREFTDAWVTIAQVIYILSRTLCRADDEFHAGDGAHEVDSMFMSINEYVVPAICQKHPRALPMDFHTNLITLVSEVLRIAVIARPLPSVLQLYDRITKEDNTFASGIVDEPATEEKLQEACGNDQKVLAELVKDLWLLQVLKGYVSTDILDIKSKGIVVLRDLLKLSHSIHRTDPRGIEHPVLQYLARFLRIGNFIEYIFSADSHASLVKECSDVVAFLAVTGTYTDNESDLIWKACTTSVEAEFVKASFEVLKNMLIYIQPSQILHMARKYTKTPASALGMYGIAFLTEAFGKFHSFPPDSELQLEPMRICFDILKRLDADPAAPSTIPLRDAAFHEIAVLGFPHYNVDHRKVIYHMCLAEIKGRTKYSTTCMEVLNIFSRTPSSEEAELLLNLLPVRAALDELVHFVRSDAKQVMIGNHSVLEAVNIRLDLVLFFIGLSVCTEDKELEESLWDCTIGDSAINSRAREDALDHFISAPQHVKHPASIETLFQRGVDQFLPMMSADCATLRLIVFLREKVKESESKKEADGLEQILEESSWQQLTRLTLTTSSERVATEGRLAITRILFPKNILRDNSHIVARQAAFARQHIDSLRTLQKEPDASNHRVSLVRGIGLLRTIHHQSKMLSPMNVAHVSPIELGDSDEAERIEFVVHIHGPQSNPIARTVQALENCHISDLGEALRSTSGIDDHDLVRNGSLTRLEDISSQTLHEAGIKASSVVSIRPRYTFDCDFGKVFASTSAVERIVLASFEVLEKLLDAEDEVAERVYHFLAEVSPPMPTRRRVLDQNAPFDEIFPRDLQWRTLYSIHILASHLDECNKLGVADQNFILHGAKLLSALLLDSTRPLSPSVLFECLPGLVSFLQERPQNSPPPPYLENPKELGLRLLKITQQIQEMNLHEPPRQNPQSTQLSDRAELSRLAYSVVLQLARTDGLWEGIHSDKRFADAHESLLLSKDISVSHTMSVLMGDFVKERPDLVGSSYLTTLISLLPTAMKAECLTHGFFSLLGEVMWANSTVHTNDASVRSIIEKLVQHVWQYRHSETADLPLVDRKFLDLLSLLSISIDVLKSFKQPLRLGDLAVDIWDRLLFCDDPKPSLTEMTVAGEHSSSTTNLALRGHGDVSALEDDLAEPNAPTIVHARATNVPPTPLYHASSRATCLEIVRKVCDDQETYGWLLGRTTQAVQWIERLRGAWFNPRHYIRAPEACSGLSNLGMTCYMNSLLQQMYSNVQFRKFIFDTPLLDASNQDLLWHVKKLFAQMQNLVQPWVDTQELARYLNISVDTQEDVHGFYTIFMSALESCLPDPTARAAFNGMFSGRLATQVQGSCGHVSARTEPFSDLSITVQNKQSLADSLAEFVQGEPMQGANKYKCLSCDADNGGKLVDAMRRTCLEDVPDHLTVCLKRFTFDMMGQESKNNDFFQFPEEIDLAQYELSHLGNADGSTTPDVFKLVGVIVHSGILTFGHYWSYVRLRYPDPNVGHWVRLEDTNSRPAQGFEEVQNECFGGGNRTHNGYVLFYQRESSFQKASSAITEPYGNLLSTNIIPPRVSMPDDLFQQVHEVNVCRQRTAQVFDSGFHKFVMDITHDFHLRASEPAASEDSSPTSETASKSDGQESSAADISLTVLLARCAIKYLEHVLLSENIPQKLSHFLLSLKMQTTSCPKLVHCLISEICADPSFFIQIVDHDNEVTRNSMRTFLRECLMHIRENDEVNYDEDVRKLITVHATQLSSLDDRHLRFVDFFSVPFEVSVMGHAETEIVCDAGYISWILDVAMSLPFDAGSFQSMPNLRDAAKKRRVGFAPLWQFMGLVLLNVNNSAQDDWELAETSVETRSSILQALLTHKIRPDSPLKWMALAIWQNADTSDWSEFPAAQLIQRMISVSPPDMETRQIISESLIRLLRKDEVYRLPLFYMVTALIASCGDSPESDLIISEVIKGVKEHDKPPHKLMLEFFETVMPFAPIGVTKYVAVWAPHWLLPQSKVSKRTIAWLASHFFVADCVSRASATREVYGTDLDVARSLTVRSLADQCMRFLLDARDVDERASYPQVHAVLSDARVWMTGFLASCEKVLRAAKEAQKRAAKALEEVDEDDDEEEAKVEDVYPRLSEEMAEEYRSLAPAAVQLDALLMEIELAGCEDEVDDEGDSSAFEDTEDEDA